MASILEKAILILAGNLNSGRSYLITAVTCHLQKNWTEIEWLDWLNITKVSSNENSLE